MKETLYWISLIISQVVWLGTVGIILYHCYNSYKKENEGLGIKGLLAIGNLSLASFGYLTLIAFIGVIFSRSMSISVSQVSGLYFLFMAFLSFAFISVLEQLNSKKKQSEKKYNEDNSANR